MVSARPIGNGSASLRHPNNKANSRIANITIRDKNDVTVIDVSGKLTLSKGSSALDEKIWEFVETGFKRILIINMIGLTWPGITSIDSSGLGALVAAYTIVSSPVAR